MARFFDFNWLFEIYFAKVNRNLVKFMANQILAFVFRYYSYIKRTNNIIMLDNKAIVSYGKR